VVKPLDNCASRGITLAHNREELLAGISFAMASNKDSGGAIIEENLSGMEYAIDSLIVDDSAIILSCVPRYFRHWTPGHTKKLFGIEGMFTTHFNPPQEVIDAIIETARRLGVTEGPFKCDFMFDKKYGWIVMECATRTSGGFDSFYLNPLIGIDEPGILLDYSLGLPFDKSKLAWNGKYACSYMPFYKPGKINGWTNGLTKELREKYKVAKIFFRSHTEVKELCSGADRSVWVNCLGDTELGALRNAIKASKFISPNYVEDKNAG
jgi:biotin carboxylase